MDTQDNESHQSPQETKAEISPPKDAMNLYINNLPLTVDTECLKLIMHSVGEFENCSVVKNRLTGENRGYGFVQFTSEEAAQQAIVKFNGCTVHGGKPISCRVAIPLSARQRKASVNLYVRNLPRNFNPDRLRELFDPYGEISSTKVISDTSGSKLGIGFVRFLSLEAAENAIKNLSGKKPAADFILPLLVELADKNDQSVIDAASPAHRPSRPKKPGAAFGHPQVQPVGIGGLRSLVGAAGQGGDIVMPQQIVVPQPVVQQTVPQQVVYPAAQPYEQTVVEPQALSIPAEPQNSDQSNVYVSGFPASWTEAELRESFSEFGEISSARVLLTPTGESRSIGFARFRTVESASRAIEKMHGTVLNGRSLTCRVANCATRRSPPPQTAGAYGAVRNKRVYTSAFPDASPYTVRGTRATVPQTVTQQPVVQYVYPNGQPVPTDASGRAVLQQPQQQQQAPVTAQRQVVDLQQQLTTAYSPPNQQQQSYAPSYHGQQQTYQHQRDAYSGYV